MGDRDDNDGDATVRVAAGGDHDGARAVFGGLIGAGVTLVAP